MERFVCGGSIESLHNAPSAEILAELGIQTPEELHLNGKNIERVARHLLREDWVTLPFCNTLCSEGLGAKPNLSLDGARVKEQPYHKAEEIPEEISLDFPRMQAMLEAIASLKQQGVNIAYEIDGPFTILSNLLPMSRMFATLRKPSGAELLTRIEDWIIQYSACLVKHGVNLISFSDPVATVDILGEKMFTETYFPYCRQMITRLAQENPGIVIHLCGKMTQSLLDTNSCEVKRWEPEKPKETYGQTLTAFCKAFPQGGMIGHFCLNLLHAKRNWLYQIVFR